MTSLSFRPLTRADAELAADLMTAGFPREPQDPVLLAYRWSHPKAGWTDARFAAEADGEPIAFLEWQHGPWDQLPERNGWVDVYLDRACMTEGLLDELWAWIEDAAYSAGARVVNAGVGEDEPEMLSVMAKRGYKRKSTDKVWRLDLGKHGAKISADAASALERTTSGGLVLTTLDRWTDPERFRKLYELHELMRQDVPHISPILPQTLEDFMIRVEAPNSSLDRWWVALDGGEPVAMSYLTYPPVRGHVWTAFTGSHPGYRGRGIARAVKLQTLAQAVELGVDEVRTDNDSTNKAMLHINETLGYELMPGYAGFEKRLPARPLR